MCMERVGEEEGILYKHIVYAGVGIGTYRFLFLNRSEICVLNKYKRIIQFRPTNSGMVVLL